MSAVLLLAVTFSMCVPAFAEEPIYVPAKMQFTDPNGKTYDLFEYSYDLDQKTMTIQNAPGNNYYGRPDYNDDESNRNTYAFLYYFPPNKDKNIQNVILIIDDQNYLDGETGLYYLFWEPVMKGKITKVISKTGDWLGRVNYYYDHGSSQYVEKDKKSSYVTTSFSYDNMGRVSGLVTITSSGQKIEEAHVTYDNKNRISKVNTSTKNYYENGNVTSENFNYKFNYDKNGKMKSGKYTESGGGTYDYTINKNGYYTSSILEDGGDGIEFTYNKAGFPIEITDDLDYDGKLKYDSHNCISSCRISICDDYNNFELFGTYTTAYMAL